MFGSVEEACRVDVSGELFVIGGSEVYSQALPFADRLYLTMIEGEFSGDAFFPQWDASRFREISREEFPRGGGRALGFSFVVLERVGSS